MLIENDFAVAAPADRLWAFLLDVERIIPCLPGAELNETVDDRTWKGTFHATFGPVAMSFAGTVTMESRDDTTHLVVLHARGMEQHGKGAAEATVTAWLEPEPEDATRVRVRSDVVLAGAAAQLSRGLLPEIARKLTQRFADCLQADMRAAEVSAPSTAEVSAPSAAPVRPIGGLRLALSAVRGAIRRFVRRIFGRSAEEE